ncbi:MAG: metallophosphoesterase [Peptococcaceae bacterium]|nr:metallophosphoesterase [Peptococcaceae bacterium]
MNRGTWYLDDKIKKITFWAIGDLHLSIGLEKSKQKPMECFGEQWVQHTAKIARRWCERVQKNDVVLLLGDTFWGNRVEEAQFALNWLGCLPGRKVMIRGNHDNWWQSISKVREALPEGMYAIQNDCLVLDHVAIAGARGWTFADPEGPEHQEKMLRREYARLEASLSQIPMDASYRIAMLHYPPFAGKKLEPTMAALLERYHVNCCVFGHLHGEEAAQFQSIEKNNIKYMLASADNVDFSPLSIYNYQYNHDYSGND